MDVHHPDASCLPDDVLPQALDDMITDGDREMDGEEQVHIKVRSTKQSPSNAWRWSYTIRTTGRRGER